MAMLAIVDMVNGCVADSPAIPFGCRPLNEGSLQRAGYVRDGARANVDYFYLFEEILSQQLVPC